MFDDCDGDAGGDDDGTKHEPSVGQVWAKMRPSVDRM